MRGRAFGLFKNGEMYLRRNRIFETGGKEEIPFSA